MLYIAQYICQNKANNVRQSKHDSDVFVALRSVWPTQSCASHSEFILWLRLWLREMPNGD